MLAAITRRCADAGFPLLCTLLATAAPACGGSSDGSVPCTRTLPAGTAESALQTALIEAMPGDVVCLEAGTYTLTKELSSTQARLTLRGLPAADGALPVLDFAAQTQGANGVSATGDDFTLEHVWVRDTRGDGVRVTGAARVTFRGVKVTWSGEPETGNGAYGLYPVMCTDVLIDDCEVSGASDAGIYVGQSQRIRVRGSRAHGNVAGIEIENSRDAIVEGCEATDNAGGILVFDLPNLPAGNGGRTLVRDNHIHTNDRANFAADGTIVSLVPRGTGVVVLGTDEVELANNRIEDNGGTGVLIFSYGTAEVAGAGTAATDTSYDPFPETIWLHDNTFTGNGTRPMDLYALLGQPALEQVLWDGDVNAAATMPDAKRICLSNNTGASFRNFDGPGNFAAPKVGLEGHECQHTPLALTVPGGDAE